MGTLARKIEKEGEYKKAKNIAIAMLQDKEDYNKIVKYTGLSKNEIEEMCNQQQKSKKQ